MLKPWVGLRGCEYAEPGLCFMMVERSWAAFMASDLETKTLVELWEDEELSSTSSASDGPARMRRRTCSRST